MKYQNFIFEDFILYYIDIKKNIFCSIENSSDGPGVAKQLEGAKSLITWIKNKSLPERHEVDMYIRKPEFICLQKYMLQLPCPLLV